MFHAWAIMITKTHKNKIVFYFFAVWTWTNLLSPDMLWRVNPTNLFLSGSWSESVCIWNYFDLCLIVLSILCLFCCLFDSGLCFGFWFLSVVCLFLTLVCVCCSCIVCCPVCQISLTCITCFCSRPACLPIYKWLSFQFCLFQIVVVCRALSCSLPCPSIKSSMSAYLNYPYLMVSAFVFTTAYLLFWYLF